MQTINFTKSGSIITAIAVGEKNFTVSEYARKFRFSYDGAGNVVITILITDPNNVQYILCKITDVSFDDVSCTDFSDIEEKIDTMFYASGGGSSYLVYTALIKQTGSDNPTVEKIFENTLGGSVVWTRNSAGSYYGTLAAAFPVDNTICPPFDRVGVAVMGIAFNLPFDYCFQVKPNTANRVEMNVYDDTFTNVELSAAAGAGSVLVEIRVYPEELQMMGTKNRF